MPIWHRIQVAAGLLAAAAPAAAQQLPYELPGKPVPSDPAEATAGKTPWLQYALLDRFEWSPEGDLYAWDFSALLGGEVNRLYLSSTGEGALSHRLEYLELDALYSRYVGAHWDLNFGLRYDLVPRPRRLYAAAGAQYDDDKLWLGAWLYLSDKGEPSGRLAAYYNWRLARRLVLQPSVELDAYGEGVPALGLGRGLAYAEAGLRLRYEIREQFAPYVGFSWSSDLGRTARLTRAAGENPETKNLVVGVRSQF